jgi:hypothetical protein
VPKKVSCTHPSRRFFLGEFKHSFGFVEIDGEGLFAIDVFAGIEVVAADSSVRGGDRQIYYQLNVGACE